MISKRVGEMLRSRASYPLAREYDIRTPGAINLASNESPYGPSPAVLRALRQEMKFMGLYPDPRATRLKRAIGDYLEVDESCVSIGNGSDELMDLVCKAFIDPGDRVLIPLPTFAMYELSCRANGGTPVFYNLPNFEWRAYEIKRALADAKLAFIGRPNNPTGNGLSSEGLRELLASGKLIIIDEAYAEFSGYSVAKQAPRRKNLLVLRTFSKAFGLAGLRVGYAVGNPEFIKAIESIRAPFNVNRLAQAAAVAALRDRRYLRKVTKAINLGRTYLREELSKLGARVFPSEANFLMVDITQFGTDAPTLCEFLAKQNIFIRDLSDFRGAGSSWVRISVGRPEQNRQLIAAIRRFKGGD